MSIRRVERDLNRFRQIVRGKIKKDLRKYMSQGEMIGRQGRKYVSIPLPQIDIPEFRYGPKNSGGVGQGPGDVGTPIGRAGETEEYSRKKLASLHVEIRAVGPRGVTSVPPPRGRRPSQPMGFRSESPDQGLHG